MTTTHEIQAPSQATTGPSPSTHPVDAIPPWPRLLMLSLQHVLAMYAGAVAVPLIVGGAMIDQGKMAPSDLPHLIAADLMVAGIATLIQALGFRWFGVRLPIMQGCTFAAVSPMLIIGGQYGPAAIYGSVIACGVAIILMAPLVGRLMWLFPPLVTGTIILVIGLTLIPVSAEWIAGGSAAQGNGSFGSAGHVGLGLATLAIIALVQRFGPSWLSRISVLVGLVVGTLISLPLGLMDLAEFREQPVIAVATPFFFGLPEFPVDAVLTMALVGLVIMIETTGAFIAVGEICDRPADRRAVASGLRADGLSTILGGVFNTFPYCAFSQNVGLVAISGVRSRYVAATTGGILIILGLLPKLGGLVAGIPTPVLGGATAALFGMITAQGVKTLSRVELDPHSVTIIAVAVAAGLFPVVEPSIFSGFPSWFSTLFSSGIAVGSITAIALNLCFNGRSAAHSPAQSETAETSVHHG